jgi:hypothetical protein
VEEHSSQLVLNLELLRRELWAESRPPSAVDAPLLPKLVSPVSVAQQQELRALAFEALPSAELPELLPSLLSQVSQPALSLPDAPRDARRLP